MSTRETPPLMDSMRPLDSDGALHSVLLSTYGLSLSDPPFFEQDFLPTLLGLGGVRDRGYSSPANVERRLGQIYCGLVCDAHALAQGGRPSLRVDVIPVGRQLHHAKVVLIHRDRLARLVIASANLTHEGFRKNREAAAVLDFHERSELSPSILADFASQWLARLGSAATQDFRRALEEAVNAAQGWKPARTGEPTVRTLWGGGEVPLWRQVVEAWPQGEPLREWQICSPFWPGPGDADTPFDVFRRELDARGANVADAKMQLFTLADVPGSRGRPCFPFPLVEQLAQRGFNPADATICPARLDALDTEVPDGKAEDQRPLHAKWVFLRGERTSLLLLGSANFTRRGLGVLRNPSEANIEVCVLLSGSAKALSTDSLVPPVAESGIVNWRDCRAESVATPLAEIEVEPWPEFISGIELEVRWETLPVTGALRVHCTAATTFSLAWEKDDEQVPLAVGAPSDEGICSIQLDETQISALLVRRRVVVRWAEPTREAFFPINIASDSKPGLPAVLGQDPTEQDLLAYFHGRIDEEDLMNLLIERSRKKETDGGAALAPPGRELQNYVVREFLEGLYGMEDLLRDSTASPRVFEQALLGEFSPVRLANETQRAFAGGRRTATATGFQLVELLRLVENLALRDEKKRAPAWFAETQKRSLEQLLRVVGAASARAEFRASGNAAPFRELVAAVLKPNTAARWWAAIDQR
jgi:hypothetical protein